MSDVDEGTVEPSRWVEITRQNPGHSSWYIERFRSMAAAGDDLDGEARFVDAMVSRGARILDAGCGPGRVGSTLARVGHQVVGVDVDPVLIAAAEADHPGPHWLVGALAELDLPARGIADGFDAIVCAGNVMPFLAASTRDSLTARADAFNDCRMGNVSSPGLSDIRASQMDSTPGALPTRAPAARERTRSS